MAEMVFHPCKSSHPGSCPGCVLESPRWGISVADWEEAIRHDADLAEAQAEKDSNIWEPAEGDIDHDDEDRQYYFSERLERPKPSEY